MDVSEDDLCIVIETSSESESAKYSASVVFVCSIRTVEPLVTATSHDHLSIIVTHACYIASFPVLESQLTL